jgi:hypothetical protein
MTLSAAAMGLESNQLYKHAKSTNICLQACRIYKTFLHPCRSYKHFYKHAACTTLLRTWLVYKRFYIHAGSTSIPTNLPGLQTILQTCYSASAEKLVAKRNP